MYLKYKTGWVSTVSDEITIGSKNITVQDLEKYYRGIHPYDSFHYRVSRYLCTLGLEEVMKMPLYKSQLEVDKVFFKTVTHSCPKFLLDWADDWKEVYRQLAASKLQFRELIINGDYYSLSDKEYRELKVEVSKIKHFFRILNMEGAVLMILKFSETVLFRCLLYMQRLPEVYPFALKGKPVTTPVIETGTQPTALIANA